MGGQPLPPLVRSGKIRRFLTKWIRNARRFFEVFWEGFGLPWASILASFFMKRTFQKSVSFLIHVFIDFGIDLGAQMPPQNFKKSL